MTTPSKNWICKEGCDLSKGVICPHLEKLLPKPNLYNRRYEEKKLDPLLMMDQAQYSALLYQMTPEKELAFISFLTLHGCEDFEIDLLVALFVDKLTFKEVAAKWHYTSSKAAHRLYTIAARKIANSISWRKKHK